MTPQNTDFDAGALVARLEALDPEDQRAIAQLVSDMVDFAEGRPAAAEVTP